MSVVYGNMIDTEHRGDLFDYRVSSCLDTVIGLDSLYIIRMDLVVINEVFFPTLVEVDPFGLDLEFGAIVILD